MSNALLEKAVHKHSAASAQGLLERLFTLGFRGLVYNQIWEDPALDMEAMALGPEHRLITIASAGCNVLNYLTRGPKQVTVVDLNETHIALTRLKLAALEHLPSHEAFFRFFGKADEAANRTAYNQYLRHRLDPATRAYWDSRRGLRGRRIDYFVHGFFRYGLLGRFIGALHALARLRGQRLARLVEARSLEEQRRLYDEIVAPLFDNRLVRAMCRLPVTFYGLGIPPAQFAALRQDAEAMGGLHALFESRVRRLACDFPIETNYFAWQAFTRRYETDRRRAVPPYLEAGHFEAIRARVGTVDTNRTSMTEYLSRQPAQSFDRYVLLDAQDWMTAAEIGALWQEITRTARHGARVIFRTAGADSPIETALPPRLRDHWDYDAAEGRALHARDRSAIYGGFHLYRLRG